MEILHYNRAREFEGSAVGSPLHPTGMAEPGRITVFFVATFRSKSGHFFSTNLPVSFESVVLECTNTNYSAVNLIWYAVPIVSLYHSALRIWSGIKRYLSNTLGRSNSRPRTDLFMDDQAY